LRDMLGLLGRRHGEVKAVVHLARCWRVACRVLTGQ
jgi:hypothetical protein